VAPRRARATVQIRLSGPLAQTEAGHSASGVWRTPVESCARTASARERDGARRERRRAFKNLYNNAT